MGGRHLGREAVVTTLEWLRSSEAVLRWFVAGALLTGCHPDAPKATPSSAGPDATAGPAGTTTAVNQTAPTSASPKPTSTAPTSTAPMSTVPPTGSAPTPFAPYSVERLHPATVQSIAVGKPPKVATYGNDPYLFDGKAWIERPLWPKESLEADGVERATIFFGRDNQPRLLGSTRSPDGNNGPLYLRHKPRGWTREPSELGGLAGATTALYGVLGYEDPEIVCAVGSFCLVKRTSGWKRMPAADHPEQFFPTSAGVFVVREEQLYQLDDVTWNPVARAPRGVISLCLEAPHRLWLTTKNTLHLRDLQLGDDLASEPVPVGEATALLCEGEGSVWVTGSKGVAHREAERWLPLEGLDGRFWTAARGHDRVLLGGDLGLFAARRAAGAQ
jgi:hypothetical protein